MDPPVSSEPGAAWHVAPHVLMRTWDGEVVAYNDETGHTYQFMELSAWMLERLSGSVMTESDLLAAAASELEPEGEDSLASSIKSSLMLFQGLGLIEPAPRA